MADSQVQTSLLLKEAVCSALNIASDARNKYLDADARQLVVAEIMSTKNAYTLQEAATTAKKLLRLVYPFVLLPTLPDLTAVQKKYSIEMALGCLDVCWPDPANVFNEHQLCLEISERAWNYLVQGASALAMPAGPAAMPAGLSAMPASPSVMPAGLSAMPAVLFDDPLDDWFGTLDDPPAMLTDAAPTSANMAATDQRDLTSAHTPPLLLPVSATFDAPQPLPIKAVEMSAPDNPSKVCIVTLDKDDRNAGLESVLMVAQSGEGLNTSIQITTSASHAILAAPHTGAYLINERKLCVLLSNLITKAESTADASSASGSKLGANAASGWSAPRPLTCYIVSKDVVMFLKHSPGGAQRDTMNEIGSAQRDAENITGGAQRKIKYACAGQVASDSAALLRPSVNCNDNGKRTREENPADGFVQPPAEEHYGSAPSGGSAGCKVYEELRQRLKEDMPADDEVTHLRWKPSLGQDKHSWEPMYTQANHMQISMSADWPAVKLEARVGERVLAHGLLVHVWVRVAAQVWVGKEWKEVVHWAHATWPLQSGAA